jgi:hypothetical protein
MRCFFVAVLAALALPAAAGAKEITAVTVCGAEACTRLTDHASLDAFTHAGGMAEEAPSTPQRSYRLRVRVSEPGAGHIEWTAYWLPDTDLIASRDDAGTLLFTGVDPALADVLRRGASGQAARAPRRFVRRAAGAPATMPAPTAPVRAAASAGGGAPWLAWAGLGAVVLLAAAAAVVRARRD